MPRSPPDVRGRPFAFRLLPLLALALALRLIYAGLIVKRDPLVGDGLEFHQLAYAIADGHGYALPAGSHTFLATADKPPLYPLVLAVFTLIGGHGWIPHQVAGALIGTGTVAVTGFLGRRVGGDRVGLVAAALAAVYPMLIAADGSFRSESLYALLVTATLLAAYRMLDRPTLGSAALCGALIGLATLTRSEAIVLLVLLVLPVARLADGAWGRALGATAVAALVALAVLAPWLARTWTRFDRPVFVSTNSGGLLAGANCAKTYHGEWLGQWRFDCTTSPLFGGRNEAEFSAALGDKGLDYASAHAGRLPVVIPVRVLRSFDLYRPGQQWRIERFFEGRDLGIERAGVIAYYVLACFAIGGAVMLRRRGRPLRILLAPLLLVVLVSALAYGFTRFRVAAEPAIVVLAAVALTALPELLRARRRAQPRASARPG